MVGSSMAERMVSMIIVSSTSRSVQRRVGLRCPARMVLIAPTRLVQPRFSRSVSASSRAGRCREP